MSVLDKTSDFLKDKVNLMLLYDVIHEFNSTLDLSVVLGRVMSLTIRALGAKRGSVFVIDERGEVVQHFLARQHLPPDIRESVIDAVMTKGAAGWVCRHRESAVVKNAGVDPRWHKFEDDLPRIHSAVVVPLLWKGEVRGIISVEHYRIAAFGDQELQLMEAIAAWAAIAIENARLYSQVRNERDRMAAILNSSEEAIVVLRGDGQGIKLVNPAAAKLLGVKPGDAIGQELSALFPAQSLFTLKGDAMEEVEGKLRNFVVVVKEIL